MRVRLLRYSTLQILSKSLILCVMQPNATLRFKKIPMKQRRTNCDCTQQTYLTNYTISTAKAKLTANNETIELALAPLLALAPPLVLASKNSWRETLLLPGKSPVPP